METGFSLALSFLIGGVLLVSILTMQGNLQTTSNINKVEEIIYSEMDKIREILKTDIDKMGHNITLSKYFDLDTLNGEDHANSIIIHTDIPASSADDNMDNDHDQINIYVGPLTDMAHTDNDSDRYIYRKINGSTPQIIASGITYFEITSSSISDLVSGQDCITIHLKLESEFAEDSPYRKEIFWVGSICPKNLIKY